MAGPIHSGGAVTQASASPSGRTDRSIPRERATAENLSAQILTMVNTSTGSLAGLG